MFSPYHATGFYCAPVSKALLGGVVLSSVAFTIPLNHYRYWFLTQGTTVKQPIQILRYLCKRLVFLDPKDVMCASILLYHFRIFERRYGSRKFSSVLLAAFFLSLILELAMVELWKYLDLSLDPLPTGPYGMIFAMFVPYFNDIPRVAMTYFLGIPVTGKSLTYVLGLQMASGSLESALLAACGVLSGLLYHKNLLWIQQWFYIPVSIASLFHYILGSVFHTAPPSNLHQPMGATLEIQRQQHIEALEQQLGWAHQQQYNRAGPAFGFGWFGRQTQQQTGQVGPPSEEDVQRLVEMGFSRDRVLTAIQSSQNNINDAMNLLLQQS